MDEACSSTGMYRGGASGKSCCHSIPLYPSILIVQQVVIVVVVVAVGIMMVARKPRVFESTCRKIKRACREYLSW